MTKYELTFLLKKDEDIGKIKEIITLEGGTLFKENNWGQKTLAYPIKKNRTAFFYNWLIEIETKKINDLRKKINFSEKILRYLLLVAQQIE